MNGRQIGSSGLGELSPGTSKPRWPVAKTAMMPKIFLRGRSRAVMTRLSEAMQVASDDMEFEQAARLRDRIRALAAVSQETLVNPESLEEADIFALHSDGGQACVQVFFFRAGQNWGNRAYFPRIDRTDPDPTILAAFNGQFYDDRTIPKLILVSCEPDDRDLLAEAFSLKSGRRVEIRRPERGEKRALVDEAVTNAREALLCRPLPMLSSGPERLSASTAASWRTHWPTFA